ncbi:aminotransferase class V-fold PLP-dependent enzyme [Veronia pacifica]|uniref:Class V aminotransferase n=1 Tax=Veronia pacifica TaxID=1080227 RepID=A0A1C3EKP7_9GAMM|nr:aminotransferase class V-fold PLP-dependent enzyme [Veronia pacifica]ODA33802.1 class V aminotransferase [Veronia pacifica]
MSTFYRKEDFYCPNGAYLLSHSVGRPLREQLAGFERDFIEPWQQSGQEPWPQWMSGIEGFRSALASLFNASHDEFCPQSNLSSGLTKAFQSHQTLRNAPVIVMAEQDFPSMGFVIQHAPFERATLRMIPAERDITDANVWAEFLQQDVDAVFISHVYSNTGQQAPVEDILALARGKNILSIVDVAQSAGVIPLDLQVSRPDFLVGSSVKWLCGGPGAGYLWINPDILPQCQPADVGWFSHQDPFEFDIHHFEFHESALRFMGGTPAVAPFVMAKQSMEYFASLGINNVHNHNQRLVDRLHDQMGEHLVSPDDMSCRGATAIVSCEHISDASELMKSNHIFIDQRKYGLRVSPHIYNNDDDIDAFVEVYKRGLK